MMLSRKPSSKVADICRLPLAVTFAYTAIHRFIIPKGAPEVELARIGASLLPEILSRINLMALVVVPYLGREIE